MKLGFLGFGSIASAVAQGCVAGAHDIRITARSAKRASAMANKHSNVEIAEPQAIIDHSDVIFIGTTAEVAPDMLRPLSFQSKQKVISFMVGIETEVLKALIAPAELEAIMIPFPSIAQGNSPVLSCPQSQIIDRLFGGTNTVVPVPTEAALNDFLAAQAVLSPSVKLLATATNWLATRTGDRHGAEQFLRLLVGGSLMAHPMTAEGVLDGLMDALNTPGGLNQQFRERMVQAGTFDAAEETLEVLAERLAKGSS